MTRPARTRTSLCRLLVLSTGTLLLGASAAAGTGPSGLDVALESIELARIKTDIFHIASDEMGGRDTPSPGLEATAQYIRQRLQDLGFQPGAPEGYFYEYPLAHQELDGARTKLVVRRGQVERTLALGQDYYIGRSSEAIEIERSGGVLWGGSFDELSAQWKRGEGVDPKGRWVLLLEQGGTVRRMAEEVEERGAAGLVFVEPADEDKPYAERFSRVTEALLSARAGRLDEGRKSAPAFPKVFLPRSALASLLELAGLSAPPASGTPLDLELSESRHLSDPGGRALLKNVCGYWPGNDPELADEVIVLSAHYDHVGRRGEQIWNGADDNASGTTGLLALAQALKTYGPMRRSVLLMWVSAEEKGLLGSEAWTKHPWLPGDAFPVADINIDMIGRNDPAQLLVTPTRDLEGEYNGLTRLVERFAPTEGFTSVKSADEYWFRSDQVNFARNLSLPVAFLFCDVHEDYHQPTDTPDKIDCDKLRRVVRLVLRMLDSLQTDKLELHERPVPGAADFELKERAGTAWRDLDRIRSAVDSFAAWNAGRSPASLEELVSFEGGARDWFPTNTLPKDPWGHDYQIQLPSDGAPGRYGCLGADGLAGGEGAAADIVLQ